MLYRTFSSVCMNALVVNPPWEDLALSHITSPCVSPPPNPSLIGAKQVQSGLKQALNSPTPH